MTNNDDFNNDDLSRRLSNLGDDLTPIRMPGPAAARKRAAQRSRNQVLSSVVAGVLVAAGVVVFRSGVVPADNTDPVESPSNTPTESLPSSPPPSSHDAVAIPDAALMQPEDIYDEWPEGNPDPIWEPAEYPVQLPACVREVGSLIPAVTAQASFANDGAMDWRVSQDVFRVDNAASTFERLRSQIDGCVPAAESPEPSAPEPRYFDKGTIQNVGHRAWVMQYATSAAGDLVTVSLVQHRDVISMVVKWQVVRDVPDEVDYVTPARAAERMCTEIFESDCVQDAEFESEIDENNSPPASEPNADPSTDPSQPSDDGPTEHALADNPFLTEDDINPVGNAGSEFAVSPPEFEANPPEAWCLDDPNGVGADDVRTRYWDNDLDAHVGEAVLQFADTDDATQYLLDYSMISDRCNAMNVNAENDAEVNDIGVVSTSNGDDALAWSVFYSPPEAGTSFMGAAIAQRDNIAVLLTFGAMSDPGNWEGYVSERLSAALDQAIAD